MNAVTALRDFILGSLRSGLWRSGDRLPTERALSEQFSLSRGSVRKVLQELRELGVISQTVGSGTYVTEQALSVLQSIGGSDPLRQTSPAELMGVAANYFDVRKLSIYGGANEVQRHLIAKSLLAA